MRAVRTHQDNTKEVTVVVPRLTARAQRRLCARIQVPVVELLHDRLIRAMAAAAAAAAAGRHHYAYTQQHDLC
jgi:hypothetical protein